MTRLNITIVQIIGSEQYEWTISKKDDFIYVVKTQHSPEDQASLIKFKWHPDQDEFLKFFKSFLMRILLENGAMDTYKSQIILHTNETNHPDKMLFQDVVDEYKFSKDIWIKNIIISNAWSHDRYEEYFKLNLEMNSAVEDIITMFIYSNLYDKDVEKIDI